MTVKQIGIDIGKNTFHVIGLDAAHYTTLVRFGLIWRHGSIAVIGSVHLADRPARDATANSHRTGHRAHEGRWPYRAKPPLRPRGGSPQCHRLCGGSQHAPSGPVAQASFCHSARRHGRPGDENSRRPTQPEPRLTRQSGNFTGDSLPTRRWIGSSVRSSVSVG